MYSCELSSRFKDAGQQVSKRRRRGSSSLDRFSTNFHRRCDLVFDSWRVPNRCCCGICIKWKQWRYVEAEVEIESSGSNRSVSQRNVCVAAIRAAGLQNCPTFPLHYRKTWPGFNTDNPINRTYRAMPFVTVTRKWTVKLARACSHFLRRASTRERKNRRNR